jgi:hypothetical protein
MGKKESADMRGEEYLKGRRAGVEGTYGKTRKGVAEETIIGGSGEQSDGGTLDVELSGAAARIYRNAVENRETPDGDKALTER